MIHVIKHLSNSGKTSLINSLAYMIRQKDGKNKWRTAADYDLGKRYKFKVSLFYVWSVE